MGKRMVMIQNYKCFNDTFPIQCSYSIAYVQCLVRSVLERAHVDCNSN